MAATQGMNSYVNTYGRVNNSSYYHQQRERREREQVVASVKRRETTDALLTFVIRLVFAAMGVIIASLGAMLGLETAFNDTWTEVAYENMGYEFTVICVITTIVYLVCQRRAAALAVVPVAFTILGIAESFVESFKYSAILPTDLLNIGTAAEVADGYNYIFVTGMLTALCIAGITVVIVTRISDPFQPLLDLACRQRSNITRAAIRTGGVLVSVVAALIVASNAYASLYENYSVEDELGFTVWYWASQDTYHEEGFVPSFVAALQDLEVEEPDGYSTEAAGALEEYIASLYDETSGSEESTTAASTQFSEVQPNVVVVMNETFADLTTFANLGVGYEGLTFYNSWTDGVIAKGQLSVSAYGGNTCNTEFEFLTGIPLAFLSARATPYSQYDLTDVTSLAKQLSELGYGTTAIHPNASAAWQRATAYPRLGFDTFISTDDGYFDDAETTRGYVSDAATYDAIIETLTSSDDPQFVFDVTIQNHSPYDTGEVDAEDYASVSWLDLESIVGEGIASETREYLANLKASDDDLAAFIEQINALDEPTIVIFFGDHQPYFTYVYTYLLGEDISDLDETQSMYQTVYAVYANYDVSGASTLGEDGTTDTMSASQLAAYVAELVGIPMTNYEKCLEVIRETITSLNVYGYLDINGIWNDLESSGTVVATDDETVTSDTTDETTGEATDSVDEEVVDLGCVGDATVDDIVYDVTSVEEAETYEAALAAASDDDGGSDAGSSGNIVGAIIANIIESATGSDDDVDDKSTLYDSIMADVDTSNGEAVYNAIVAIAELKGTNPMLEVWEWLSYLNFIERV